MKTNKLADYIVKTDTNHAFGIELTENIVTEDMVSYVVVYSDLSADSAWCDSHFETFKTVEDADKAIQSFIDQHHATATNGLGVRVLDAQDRTTESGIKHEFILRRNVSAWRSGFLDISYEVVHSWGEMDNGEICQSNHGHHVYEHEDLGHARYGFDYYTKEEYCDTE